MAKLPDMTVVIGLDDETRKLLAEFRGQGNDREQRGWQGEGLEVRESAEGPILAGLAIPYDSWSQPIGKRFYEKVMPGACRAVFAPDADIMALAYHNEEQPLGRTTSRTLKLIEDPKGVRFELSLDPEAPHAKGVLNSVKRGDVTGMSFSFRTLKDRWEGMHEGLPVRLLDEIKVDEISPVVWPAYKSTSVAKRAMDWLDSYVPPWKLEADARARAIRLRGA